MLIRLTRLSNERHRLEIVRDDGTREAHDMETRSALLHDLVHYAVESEAGLCGSFFGRLARGETYESLMAAPPTDPEPMQTEAVVARIQGAAASDAWASSDPNTFASAIAGGFRALGEEPPQWLSGELIARVRERLRRVQGRWRATPFHETLELDFPARDSVAANARAAR